MTSSNAVDMDQDLAKFLFNHGATLIVTDVPTGTDFGIDLKSWNTGENFKGMKMIPPGFHFIHYSVVNEFGELAPRVGWFHTFKEKEFVVKKWDIVAEDMSSEAIDGASAERFKENLKALDKFLGPYPYDTWKLWKELTSKINEQLIARCQPLCGRVRSALELESCNDLSRPRGSESRGKTKRKSGLTSEEKEQLLLPHLTPKSGTELRLTKIPEKNYPDNATPNEITQHSLDTSYVLNTLLKNLNDPLEIIGELQLSFVCFLVGQSLDSFDHWKKLIALICGADKAIPALQNVYIEFLSILEIQLSHVPEDILCDIVANNNFVYHNLRILFASIEFNSSIDDRLKSKAIRLRTRLLDKFMWEFEHLMEENDDEAPVVVAFD